MPFPTLEKDPGRITVRRASVFIAEHDTSTGAFVAWHNLGIIGDAMVKVKPKNTSKDTHGSVHTYGFEYELSFVQKQTSSADLAAIPTIMREKASGTKLKFTNAPSADGTGEGLIVDGLAPFIEDGTIDLSGGESGMGWKATWEGDRDSIAQFGVAASAADADEGVAIGDVLINASL